MPGGLFFVDFDVDLALNVRPQLDLGERGVPAVGGVERAQAHQTMDALFALQVAISVVAQATAI